MELIVRQLFLLFYNDQYNCFLTVNVITKKDTDGLTVLEFLLRDVFYLLKVIFCDVFLIQEKIQSNANYSKFKIFMVRNFIAKNPKFNGFPPFYVNTL